MGKSWSWRSGCFLGLAKCRAASAWADPGQVKEERNGRRVSRHGDWAIHGVLVTALALARRRDHPG